MPLVRITVIAALLAAAGCAGHTGAPLPVAANAPIEPDAAVTQTIPTWHSSFTHLGTPYSFTMAGTNPALGTPTTIPTVIIPVRLAFSNGIALDGRTVAASIAASPLFTTQSYLGNNTQYADAILRSEWWRFAQHNNYHVRLGAPHVEPELTVAVPAADGSVKRNTNGSLSATLTFAWFIDTIEPELLRHWAVKPSQIAIFATVDTRVLEISGGCCYNGYHSDFHETTATGPAIFETAWGLVNASTPKTMDHIGHEIAELLNDPFYTNHVPPWKFPTVNACGDGLMEVGDPVVLDTFTVGGYDFEDAAFYSWFSRDNPSIGIDGRYDLLGRLRSVAADCT